MKKFSELGYKPRTQGLIGKKISIDEVINESVIVECFRIEPSKYSDKGNGKCLYLQVIHNGQQRVVFTGSVNLQDIMSQTKDGDLPFEAIIKKVGKGYEFS